MQAQQSTQLKFSVQARPKVSNVQITETGTECIIKGKQSHVKNKIILSSPKADATYRLTEASN